VRARQDWQRRHQPERQRDSDDQPTSQQPGRLPTRSVDWTLQRGQAKPRARLFHCDRIAETNDQRPYESKRHKQANTSDDVQVTGYEVCIN